MQKFTKFALSLVMAFIAIVANAQTWSAPETAPAAGSNIVDNDDITVATVYATTINAMPFNYGDYEFQSAMQVRVDAAPSADNVTGTERSGSTPLVLTVKKTGTLTVYMRRQPANDAYVAGDGKDVAVVDQTAPTTKIAGAITFIEDIEEGKFGFCKESFELEAGHTYTVFARGTTLQLSGFNYSTGAAAGWDGTVTTSMDNGVVTKLKDLDNLKLTFPGASTIAILDEEECQYMALQNADGSELYGIWGPTMGSTYTIEGNTITLGGFMPYPGATIAIPAGTSKLYIEDYGTLAIDGEGKYLETMEFAANIAGGAQPFDLTSVTNNGVAGSVVGVEASEQGVLYQFNVTATGKALKAGEAKPTLSMLESDMAFGDASVIAFDAEEAYIRFMTPQQQYFTTPGTYVLSIPEGTFVDAEGAPNAAVTAKWVIIQGGEKGSFAITGASFAGAEAGSEVEALSYSAEITAANAITALHEGNITLTDANNQPVGGNATVMGYEGEGGSKTVYARFSFDTEDHQLHTPGVYTLNIPAGMFKDAEGNLNEAYSASWTVKASGDQTINIEKVEVGTVTDTSFGFNDVYYTATVKFAKPAGAKYAYSEGLHMELNGENTGVAFQFGDWGIKELEDGDEVTLVYKDMMIAATDDPNFDNDIRPAGSYVGSTEITFLDENQHEIPGVVAKFTGSIVLPNLNEVALGDPETFQFNVDQEPFYGRVTMGDLEANGLTLTFPESRNITPEMTIKVVADLQVSVPTMGATEGTPVEMQTVLENVEFTGDAMFGAPSVNFAEFLQYIAEAGAGNAFAVVVKSVEVVGTTGVEASWVADSENPEEVSTLFEVYETLVIENVQAVVSGSEPNTWGDQFYQVTLTVPADEFAGLGVAKAYCPEGVKFTKYLEDEPWVDEFTFMPTALEGVEVAEEEDIVFTCKDYIAGKTSDETYESELRAEGADIEAMAVIILCDENDEEIGTAEFRGLLTLDKSVFDSTGINAVKFNVTDVKYNLSGQRVNNAKGIVIMNGKKVVLK